MFPCVFGARKTAKKIFDNILCIGTKVFTSDAQKVVYACVSRLPVRYVPTPAPEPASVAAPGLALKSRATPMSPPLSLLTTATELNVPSPKIRLR